RSQRPVLRVAPHEAELSPKPIARTNSHSGHGQSNPWSGLTLRSGVIPEHWPRRVSLAPRSYAVTPERNRRASAEPAIAPKIVSRMSVQKAQSNPVWLGGFPNTGSAE